MVHPGKKPYKYNPQPEGGALPGKRIMIGAGIVLVVVVAVVFLLGGRATEFIPELVIPTITPPEEAADCNTDACLMNLAQQENNPTLCDLILNETREQQCLESIASTSFDACEQILDYGKKVECAMTHAQLEQSIRPCQRLGLVEDDRRACIESVDPCYFEPDGQNLCRALESGDVLKCEGEESCVTEYALQTGNHTSCGAIEELARQYTCVSLVMGEPVCDELAIERNRDYCYELYSKKSDQNHCDQITDGTEYERRCYSYFAILQSDSDICAQVDLAERWNCYRNYSAETGDIAGCQAIHQLAIHAYYGCIFDLALIHADPVACQDIDFAGERERCYSGSIYEHEQPIDIEKCGQVTSEPWKNACYTEVAIENNDTSVCTMYIEAESSQGLCERRVQGILANITRVH